MNKIINFLIVIVVLIPQLTLGSDYLVFLDEQALNDDLIVNEASNSALTGMFAQGDTDPIQIGGDPGVPIETTSRVENPVSSNTFIELIERLLNGLIFIAIPLSILAIVYAGFQFVAAQGKQEGLKKAKRNITYVAAGLLIILGSRLILAIIRGTLESI